jgi:hypothetical protein
MFRLWRLAFHPRALANACATSPEIDLFWLPGHQSQLLSVHRNEKEWREIHSPTDLHLARMRLLQLPAPLGDHASQIGMFVGSSYYFSLKLNHK